MIRTIVFDLGKVLVDFDYAIAARRLAAQCSLTAPELARVITESSVFIQYETGLVSTEQFYHGLCSATGFRGSLDEFGAAFADIFTEIQPMVRIQTALRKHGFPTFIFSNTNDLAIRHIRKSFPFFSDFDGYVLSYEHHAMKPDPKLYEVIERLTGRRGAEILYLDDRLENIATAADRGWQVILQETPEKSRAAIEKLGLLLEDSSLITDY